MKGEDNVSFTLVLIKFLSTKMVDFVSEYTDRMCMLFNLFLCDPVFGRLKRLFPGLSFKLETSGSLF